MVVCESSINNIMGGIENTGGVTLHNHRRKLKQRFDIIKKLGQGTYGKVQLGINKETGQEVAIKTIKKCKIETEADLVRIRREIQIMSSVQHPNIIHIYEVFENREKMVLVMEYAAGGELYDYLSERKVLSEDEARRIFRQIATAVYYCHKHKICHRDLKLENILLDENGSAKIADFGLSNVFDDRRLLSTFCGSPLYASPEIVKGTPYHGPEVDCWSLGVLLYTLVYGAMPFDGSNFKRLVKQISQGDYFEPKKPSSASPLIREMLTVIPEKRANIENICAHWWVNANYTESCLEIAEDLANQTPVRLDLLLSLAPPPPPVGTDKPIIAGESSNIGPPAAESSTPARSQSVGSLMELVPPAERRIRDLVSEDQKCPKRKLEVTVSTENANLSNSGAKRKEKPQKKEEEAPILTKNLTQTMVRDETIPEAPKQEVAVEEGMNDSDPNLQGAACSELIEESNKKKEEMKEKEKKKVVKIVKKKVPTSTAAVPETNKDQTETEAKTVDKENKTQETSDEKKEDTKIPVKRKTVKKVLTDKSSNVPNEKTKTEVKKPEEKTEDLTPVEENKTSDKNKNEEATPPSKPVARRQSKIFETAEKFQNLLQSNDSKSSVLEKPKKIFIPGVNVGGFKKEFERKASLTSPPDVKKVMSKKTVPPSNQSKQDEVLPSNSANSETEQIPNPTKEIVQTEPVSHPQNNDANEATDERKLQERKKNAVDIISNAIKDGTRKSKSRPCMMRKPPVPFGINGRSASGSIGLISSQFSPTITKSPELSSPEENSVKSSAEVTLKSATLPRRKTTKAEIQLDYPPPRPATMEFKTEMAHRIESKPELKTQRSEIIVPVNNNINNRIRSSSLDPELKPKPTDSPKERIIPISFERDDNNDKHDLSSPQAKPPMPKPFPATRPVQPQRFGSISRQSTHDSDTETTVSENMEPIRKSPREYIIPIAVEGGGYVTPRATSLEPSETGSVISSGRRSMPRFGRSKRMGEDGSEEDISFSSLHRHNSVGRDSDNEDSRREPFHMHRLRSSRPTRKANLEHADSLSSGEEDDDDGFEILTAENLFSTLLSRVRSLTQRLNVEDNGRLGFPNTRLLGNFDHGSKLWNLHNDTLSRFSPMDRTFREPSTSSVSSRSSAPWRRSVSRDLASDIERVFNDTPAATATLPRDKSKKTKEANLYDLDLSELKLTDEDALALSYLTPGLSRRIQNQLLSQLPPRKEKSQSKISVKKPKDYVFSDSSDSELFSGRNNDSLLNEYNFPRPPKHSYSSSRASEYSPIAESPILQEPKLETNHVESKPLNIYRLEDIKKEYNIDKTDNNKYTPFKNCYRSTSLVEPSSSSSYKNPLYFRNVNYSSESFDSKYGSEKPISSSTPTKYNTINPRTYGLTKHQEDIDESLSSTTRRTASASSSSRFGMATGTSNYYDNCVYSKERKKRELETQKVLKEIRNKRINDHRDKYSSREREHKNSVTAEPIVNHTYENHNNHEPKSEKSGDTSSECSTVDKSIKSDEKEEKNIKREGKISKLIRPKSYPTECRTETRTPTNVPETKSKLKKRSPSVDKSSPAKDLQNSDGKKHSNNQFLSSIEKKIRSFYSESQSNNEKAKNDVNSRIQNTIRSLREQSEPRNIEHCVTESGLIKRAVSSEDFSVFGSNTKPVKTLQPSRKSVSKILGLFKKYEDKDKQSTKAAKTEENGTTKKNKSSVDGINKKIKTKSDSSSSKSKRESSKTPVNIETNDIAKKSSNSTSKLKSLSKLPIRGLSVEPEILPEKRQSTVPETSKPKLPVEEISYKPERKDLKLNLTKKTSDFKYRDYNNDVSTDNDNSSALFSPCDESNDSWSVCSDLHRQDMSPSGDNKLYSEDEGNESVSDRIRRKSFYCRFNEKKKPRKTSLTDYNTKFDLKYPEVSSNHSKSSRSSKKYDDTLHKSLSNSSYAYNPTKNDSKLCKRTLSMNDNYYTTYNPKYRESSIPTSNSSNEKSVEYNNEKSLSMKPKRSLLKTPTKIREKMSMSPPLQDFDNFGPSTSNNHDIPAPM